MLLLAEREAPHRSPPAARAMFRGRNGASIELVAVRRFACFLVTPHTAFSLLILYVMLLLSLWIRRGGALFVCGLK